MTISSTKRRNKYPQSLAENNASVTPSVALLSEMMAPYSTPANVKSSVLSSLCMNDIKTEYKVSWDGAADVIVRIQMRLTTRLFPKNDASNAYHSS